MASVTNAIAGGTADTSNTTSYASGSFTPAQGDLLVVGVQATGTTASTPTLTASANGITFTRLSTTAVKNGSADTQYVFVANQLVGASPSSMTVTFNCSQDAATGAIIEVARVDSMSKTGTAAVLQAAKVDNVAGGTAPQTVFGSNAQTGNVILFFVHTTVGTGFTQPPSHTKQVDATYSTPTTGGGYTSRNSGFTGTTITLGSSSNGACSAVALELDTTANTQALAGEVDATSAAAGSIGLASPLTGEVDASTTVAGTARLAAALSGEVDGISGVSGAIAARLALTGEVDAISAAAGSIGTLLGFSGTVAGVTAAAGSIGSRVAFLGTVAGVTAAAGTIGMRAAMSGTVVADLHVGGSPTLLAGFTGVVPILTDVEGDPAALLVLDGTVVAVSTVAGAITADAHLGPVVFVGFDEHTRDVAYAEHDEHAVAFVEEQRPVTYTERTSERTS